MHVHARLRTVLACLLIGICPVTQAASFVYVSNADSKEISVLLLDSTSNDLLLVQTVPVGGQVMPLAVRMSNTFRPSGWVWLK